MEHISALKVIFLGVVQGLTEFLPISSSAHLVIFQQWLGLSKEGVFLMALDVALHFGTLGAVVLVFYRELVGFGKSIVQWTPETAVERKTLFWILIGTVPAGILGLIFKDFFEILFADAIPASFFLIITGWILWLTKFVQYSKIDFAGMSQRHAWLVGLAQAVAILPGISRSGSTIAAGLFLKLKPETAVRYSFLLAIPAIAGATLVELKHLAVLKASVLFSVILGVLFSFGVGYLSIRWVFKLVAGRHLHRFSWYCWGLGSFVLIKEFFL